MPFSTALPAVAIVGAAPSPELASAANLALYSAMAVFTIAMLLYTAYLAALGPVSRAGQAGERAKELVAVGADATGASSGSGGSGGVVGGADGAAAAVDADDADDAAVAGPSLRARKLAGSAYGMTCLATLVLVGSVVLRGLAVMRPPWGNMFEFATAGATAAAVAYCLLARRNRWEWLGLFVVGPVLLTLGTALLAFYTEAAELMPALKSVWLIIHVTVAILAVGVFVLGFSVGVVYLVKSRREATTPDRRTFWETLPSAASLERTAYGLNMVGFILWTFTLVAGAIWAQKAWGSYWTWDPKEVWTFVVWVVYAAYMHARATAGWEPRKAMWIAIAGFVTVVLNFAVVNVYFVGQHSYSGL
ncbi:MAG: c-type cytochrome biogenesis protein CcsB [Actinomycetales bacterium]|jgi:cytochrome c-type biogenesis protein CcsB|uniref:C-type cytochrome biogenesis protein CcsB n=1 Tax=Candidatus Phosphoribacter hodrii TaxID=2953743 RepID=A0A935IVL6_9MICO|nr:c-type cytochrome biogenesis protein CcsB [Candidatus Phosphoribacter hodrii]HOA02809.1 c-type cytochrome biogenesis protein CcsB [Dermatophilaceae bacterium]HOI03678.1 c-type cytochrome biogenesis protein CcsB [Dermatophilaceae bacterium]